MKKEGFNGRFYFAKQRS